jgi:hypothetical protein
MHGYLLLETSTNLLTYVEPVALLGPFEIPPPAKYCVGETTHGLFANSGRAAAKFKSTGYVVLGPVNNVACHT